jgi:hypothetical protein
MLFTSHVEYEFHVKSKLGPAETATEYTTLVIPAVQTIPPNPNNQQTRIFCPSAIFILQTTVIENNTMKRSLRMLRKLYAVRIVNSFRHTEFGSEKSQYPCIGL